LVISIIAILAGMLLPALNQAREKAKSLQCVSNLKQLGVFVASYRADCNGYMPGTWGDAWTNAFRALTYNLIQFGNLGQVWDAENNCWAIKNYQILNCPTDMARQNCALKYRFRSYATNYYTSWAHGNPLLMRPERLKNPGSLIYMADGHSATGDYVNFSINYFPFSVPSMVDMTTSRVDFRHASSTNALFLDSHVESMQRNLLINSGVTYIYVP